MDETKCILLGFGSSALDPTTLSISPELQTMLHPAEVHLLRTLLPLGAAYQKVRQFCTAVAIGRVDGLYSAAFASGARQVVELYEKTVKNASSVANLNEIRKNFGPAMDALLEIVTVHQKTAVVIELLQQFVTNQEFLPSFRSCIGESAIMGLLFVIAHYVAHGVILHNCPDFFIKLDATTDNDVLVVNTSLLSFGISEELAISILVAGRERHTLIRESKSVSSWAKKGIDPAATAIFNSLHNASLCAGGVLALDELETRVEAAKGLWSRTLWQSVGLANNIHTHLMHIRDMFLCHRGDLWQTFVERYFPVLVSGASGSAGHAAQPRIVAECFRTACTMTMRDCEEMIGSFSVGLESVLAPSNFPQPQLRTAVARFDDVAQKMVTQLKALRVQFKLPPGVHLLVSRSALSIYQSVFSFNMRMRFSFYALLQTRLLLRDVVKRMSFERQSSSSSSSNATSALVQRTLALLQILTFVQSNLGYYIQVDVIETHYATLIQGLENIANVERAKQIHDRFVLAVAEGCFHPNETTRINPILEVTELLFTCSLTLYVICANKPTTAEREAATHSHALVMLESKVTKELIPVLVGSLSISTKSSERALWSRIDFNRFFSSGGSQNKLTSVTGQFPQPTGVPVSLTSFQPTTVKPQTTSLKSQHTDR